METITLYYGFNGSQYFWESPGTDGFNGKGHVIWWFPSRPHRVFMMLEEADHSYELPSVEECLRKAHDLTGKRFELNPSKQWCRVPRRKNMQLCSVDA